ncbi:MAG: hypothetical protein ACRC35_00910 [Angustibacter sp.]
MMRTDSRPGTPEPAACLATAAAFLARASDLTWNQARSNPDPVLRLRGLGLDLATSQALQLLPNGTTSETAEDIAGDDPLELIRAGEQILRRCPIDYLPAGASQLIAAVCDLTGEHTP